MNRLLGVSVILEDEEMKIVLCTLLVLALVDSSQYQMTEEVKTDRINGTICRYWDEFIPDKDDGQTWMPTREDVIATEAALESYLRATPHHFALWKKADRIKFWESLKTYKRQYRGGVHNGRKFILCNLYCDNRNRGCAQINVSDGGDCYVHITFDAKTKKVMRFFRNGDA